MKPTMEHRTRGNVFLTAIFFSTIISLIDIIYRVIHGFDVFSDLPFTPSLIQFLGYAGSVCVIYAVILMIFSTGASFIFPQKNSLRFIALTSLCMKAGKFLVPINIVALALASITLFIPIWRPLEGAKQEVFEKLPPSRVHDLPNIIFILVDTLRADHLGCYGYTHNTSPFIDSIAQRGVMFENCIVQSSFTVPSMASILTGLYPATTGATSIGSVLRTELVTMAELLRKIGYKTIGFSSNPSISADLGWNQGFDYFKDAIVPDSNLKFMLRNVSIRPVISDILNIPLRYDNHDPRTKITSDEVNSLVYEFFSSDRNLGSGIFLYLHYMDPHSPYIPPKELVKDGEFSHEKIPLYDGEIRLFDRNLNELVSFLEKKGMLSNSLFILTSDHGEELGEHGYLGHGKSFYEGIVRVPLIFMRTGRVPVTTRIVFQVQGMDILPTILDFTGAAIPESLRGKSLKDTLLEGKERECDFVYSEIVNGPHRTGDSPIFFQGSLRYRNIWKYMVFGGEERGRGYLFNLVRDPMERIPYKEEDTAKMLMEKYGKFRNIARENALTPRMGNLSPSKRERLKALGYL